MMLFFKEAGGPLTPVGKTAVWRCAPCASGKGSCCSRTPESLPPTAKAVVARAAEPRTVPTPAEARQRLAVLRKQGVARGAAPASPRADWRDDPVMVARYEKARAEAAERVWQEKRAALAQRVTDLERKAYFEKRLAEIRKGQPDA